MHISDGVRFFKVEGQIKFSCLKRHFSGVSESPGCDAVTPKASGVRERPGGLPQVFRRKGGKGEMRGGGR